MDGSFLQMTKNYMEYKKSKLYNLDFLYSYNFLSFVNEYEDC